MKYMGSKNRIAKDILPIILKDIGSFQYYVEPFVGGANMIDKVDGYRIGADSNKYLIALLKEMQKDDFEAPIITEEKYRDIKLNRNDYSMWIVGFAGFQLSYGAMWFTSYRKDSIGKRNYALEAKNNIDKQAGKVKGIDFICCDYFDLSIPPNSIIYCDPPYKNTATYTENKDDFNHDKFWGWCREMTRRGNNVFISEYNAPDDFECIWQKEIVSSLTKNTGSKTGTEKLFVLKLNQ